MLTQAKWTRCERVIREEYRTAKERERDSACLPKVDADWSVGFWSRALIGHTLCYARSRHYPAEASQFVI